jgi:hypothetical protein
MRNPILNASHNPNSFHLTRRNLKPMHHMSFVENWIQLEFFIIFHILNASTFNSFKKNHFLVGITIEDVQTYVLVVALGIELYFKLVGSFFCMPTLRASSIIACLVTNISILTCELSLHNCYKFALSTSGFHHGMFTYMWSLRSFMFFPFDAFYVLVVHFDLFFASQSTFCIICWDWVERGVCWCFACLIESFAKKKVAQLLND